MYCMKFSNGHLINSVIINYVGPNLYDFLENCDQKQREKRFKNRMGLMGKEKKKWQSDQYIKKDELID